jgi:hypothetical protein
MRASSNQTLQASGRGSRWRKKTVADTTIRAPYAGLS